MSFFFLYSHVMPWFYFYTFASRHLPLTVLIFFRSITQRILESIDRFSLNSSGVKLKSFLHRNSRHSLIKHANYARYSLSQLNIVGIADSWRRKKKNQWPHVLPVKKYRKPELQRHICIAKVKQHSLSANCIYVCVWMWLVFFLSRR